MEEGRGSFLKRTWHAVLCWEGTEREGCRLSLDAPNSGSRPHRWHPINDEFPCSYEPFGKLDRGEFD